MIIEDVEVSKKRTIDTSSKLERIDNVELRLQFDSYQSFYNANFIDKAQVYKMIADLWRVAEEVWPDG